MAASVANVDGDQDSEDLEEVTMRQCREAFHLFDKGTGWLLTKDLGQALRALGQIPSEQELDMMTSKLEHEELYDKGYTKLTFQEFYQVVQENSERSSDIREMVLESFKSLDPKNTGMVDAAKLSSLLTSMGEALTSAEMKELLQDAGVGKEGKVNYVKFVDTVMQLDILSQQSDKGGKDKGGKSEGGKDKGGKEAKG